MCGRKLAFDGKIEIPSPNRIIENKFNLGLWRLQKKL